MEGVRKEALVRTSPIARRTRSLSPLITAVVGVLFLVGCSDTAATTTTVALTTTVASSTTVSTTTTAASTTTAPAEIPERALFVPAAEPAVIDGIIDDGEWEGAVTVSLSNDDTVYWMHGDDTLYVALDGTEVGAVNLVIATGDELWILHSSAALGSSLYLAGESGWEQSHGYSWCCRSASDDTARLDLFEREGWQANIGFTGDAGVVEYQVAIPWGYATAALAYFTETSDPAYWPTDLPPDAVSHLTGNRWTDPELDPDEWWMIAPGA